MTEPATQHDAVAAGRPVPAGEGRHVWFSGNLVTIKLGGAGDPGPSALEARMHPGHAPPLHVHRGEDEAFHLLAGEMRFRCGEQEFTLHPGDFLMVPRGTPHAFRVGPAGAHTLQFATAGSLATFMEAAGEPAAEPTMPPNPAFDRAAIARIAAAHDMEIVGPPLGG